ncbi:hypothetical protein CF98_34085 [Halopseudomonas bauzanensis]|nr:hypothetical protein CF98_34085 [Halopseudomonas bauzanensis]
MEDCPDLVGKEGAQQGDFLAGNGKIIGQIEVNDIAVWRATALRCVRIAMRFGAECFIPRPPLTAFMCKTMLHFQLSTP